MFNIGAFITAIISVVLFRAYFYSPLAFGKQWRKLVKPKNNDLQNILANYICILIMAFVSVLCLALLMLLLHVNTMVNGALFGMVLGSAFASAFALNHYLFEDRSLELFVINAGYDIFSLMLAGTILGIGF